MNINVKLAAIILFCLFLFGCSYSDLEPVTPEAVSSANSSSDSEEWHVVEPKVLSSTNRFVRSKAVSGYDLQDILFLNDRIGWISAGSLLKSKKSSNSLLKTTDGGQTWTSIRSPVTNTSNYSQLFLAGEELGWMVLQDETNGKLEGRGTMFFVSKDGGETWRQRGTLSDYFVNKLIYSKKGTWWTTGNRQGTPSEPVEVRQLTDSEGADLSSADRTPEIPVPDRGTAVWSDIETTLNSEVVLLDSSGELFESKDDGNSWRLLFRLPLEKIGPIGLPAGNFRRFKQINHETSVVLSGKDSQEGASTDLYILNNSQRMQKLRFLNYSFTDLTTDHNYIYLSGTRVEYDQARNRIDRRSVVVGAAFTDLASWNILYQSSPGECPSLCSISKMYISETYLYGVGKGQFIKLGLLP